MPLIQKDASEIIRKDKSAMEGGVEIVFAIASKARWMIR